MSAKVLRTSPRCYGERRIGTSYHCYVFESIEEMRGHALDRIVWLCDPTPEMRERAELCLQVSEETKILRQIKHLLQNI